ncbi:YtzI protein [Virgibacillus xinjiangensis]|uniref:YtzI protein n=1 Tax=Virgibacillus xinjiangensis TaxID=393090 RepID=A0ABV7CSX9_9BACI
MWMYITAAIVIAAIVLALSLFTISKGYEYEHTIDPPLDEQNNSKTRETKEEKK